MISLVVVPVPRRRARHPRGYADGPQGGDEQYGEPRAARVTVRDHGEGVHYPRRLTGHECDRLGRGFPQYRPEAGVYQFHDLLELPPRRWGGGVVAASRGRRSLVTSQIAPQRPEQEGAVIRPRFVDDRVRHDVLQVHRLGDQVGPGVYLLREEGVGHGPVHDAVFEAVDLCRRSRRPHHLLLLRRRRRSLVVHSERDPRGSLLDDAEDHRTTRSYRRWWRRIESERPRDGHVVGHDAVEQVPDHARSRLLGGLV